MNYYFCFLVLYITITHSSDCSLYENNIDKIPAKFSWSQTHDFGKPYTHVLGRKDVNNTVASSGAMKIISESGRYYFTQDMHISPINTDVTCLKITTSNVILDLRGYSVMGNTTTGSGMIGIEVASNLSNIMIVNGTLSALHGIGIKVNSGCNNIYVENITVTRCTHTGILLDTITDAHLHEVTVNKCDGSHASSSGAIGLHIASSSRIHILNSHFDGNQVASSGNAIGVYCNQSSQCDFVNCSAVQNKAGSTTGDTAYGFYINDATDSNIFLKECFASHNQSQDGKCYGFYSANTYALYMNDCVAIGNTAAGATTTNDCVGFGVVGSGSCLLKNCLANHNGGSQASYGFFLSSTIFTSLVECVARNQFTTSEGATKVAGFYTSGGQGNSFEKCISFGNASGSHASAHGIGFYVDNTESYLSITSCMVRANTSSGGTGYGIWLADATACIVRANELFVNTGGTNGYGIKDDASSSISCYLENFAYGNGKSNGLIINNYDVKLSPNDTYAVFPVQVAYITDFSTLKQSNRYDNVELLERVITTNL